MTRVKRSQLIRQAEGFLELATALNEELPLDYKTKKSMADRSVVCLNSIRQPMGHKPYVLFLKGRASGILDQHREAVNYFEQSRRIDPDNIHLYFALAWSYKRCNRLSDAIIAMQTAVELDAESGLAHYNLACYYALDEQLESALLHLSYAFELESDFREMAIFESDFDLIRSDPRFASMTEAVV